MKERIWNWFVQESGSPPLVILLAVTAFFAGVLADARYRAITITTIDKPSMDRIEMAMTAQHTCENTLRILTREREDGQ